MTGQLYEYVILLNPTNEEKEAGVLSKVVQQPKQTMAVSEHAIVMSAARELGPEFADKLDRIEVAVRPF